MFMIPFRKKDKKKTNKKAEQILVSCLHTTAQSLNIRLGWGHSFKPTSAWFETGTSEQVSCCSGEKLGWKTYSLVGVFHFTWTKKNPRTKQKFPTPSLRETKRLALYKQQMLQRLKIFHQ